MSEQQTFEEAAAQMVMVRDQVLVRPDKVEEERTPGGIIVPTQGRRHPLTGTVAATGPDALISGAVVRVGARVACPPYAGVEVRVQGTIATIVRVDDLLCVVPPGITVTA